MSLKVKNYEKKFNHFTPGTIPLCACLLATCAKTSKRQHKRDLAI